ncbi:uncharacterized protein LOC126380737 [Pectinophora gossypiella]|uniref:uncharacterized protein LOC126380737 n=1 Tax=Pectinophora gossypiella TaxID=13191 RepID=UPI00214F0F45|nr:uncharacterized protein LOC126380737 [Pectinophora gossypiella]
MLASLSNNTIKQYDTCLKKWFAYCHQNNLNTYNTSVTNVLSFLTHIYNEGAKYGTLNSCRSALSLLLGQKIINNDFINRFLKGVFNLRPTLPKYNLTWDIDQVLNFIANWYPNEDLNLEKISKKLITLFALVTAHRAQTFSLIKAENITHNDSGFIIKIPDLIKTSRVGSQQPVLSLPYFSQRPEICPAKTLNVYLNKTRQLRQNTNSLFISFRKPHRSVCSQTLSRWVKNVLTSSGIDTNVFSAHSTRHAATSKALKLGVSLDSIRKTAGWSANSLVFAKYYNKLISNNVSSEIDFARNILS